jgi:xylulose-5-phosphate/fructose-6-phosphate phosphoketolase
MIVLNTPKGWTGPKVVDGKKVEGTFRAHQVPLSEPSKNPEHLKQLEEWLKSYRPEELFDDHGGLREELAELSPRGPRRMGANPHANGGLLLKNLRMPDFKEYGIEVSKPGGVNAEDTRVLGKFLRDVIKLNDDHKNFRVFGPDETMSNRLNAVFDVTERQWIAQTIPGDEHLAAQGRVMEVLSEISARDGWSGYCDGADMAAQQPRGVYSHCRFMFNQHAMAGDAFAAVAVGFDR